MLKIDVQFYSLNFIFKLTVIDVGYVVYLITTM